MSQITDAVLRLLSAQTPGATDPIIRHVLMETVGEMCREVFQINPPVDPTGEIADWLSDARWTEHHTTILAGTLARLYAQPNKPWTNGAAAQANATLYASKMPRAREFDASAGSVADNGTVGKAYTRLLNNLRSSFPDVRDPLLSQEVFNTVDDLTRNVLQTTPPVSTQTPDNWLTDDQWEQTYRIVLAGATVRLLTQPGKPWTNPTLAAFYQNQWDSLSTLARADATGQAKPDPVERLMGNLRSNLPNAKDSQIKQALFNVVMDACKRGYIWQEEVPVFFKANQRTGNVVPPDTQIVLLQNFYHPTVGASAYQYDNGNLALRGDLPNDFHLEPFVLTMALAPLVTADPEYPSTWVPYDLWSKHHELLLNGVMASMMLQPAKPYSNPALGQMHARLFARDLNNATISAKDRGLPTQQHWRFPRFA